MEIMISEHLEGLTAFKYVLHDHNIGQVQSKVTPILDRIIFHYGVHGKLLFSLVYSNFLMSQN